MGQLVIYFVVSNYNVLGTVWEYKKSAEFEEAKTTFETISNKSYLHN